MASRTERRRRLERERWARHDARQRAAAQRAADRRRVALAVSGVALVTALAVALAVWQLGYSTDVTTTGAPSASPPAAATDAAAAGPCRYVDSDVPAVKDAGRPSAEPLAATAATLQLSAGQVQVELLPQRAPCAVGSFAHLATAGYFDATPCHRLSTSAQLQVLQCGDPSGAGNGGPGYTFADEGLDGASYPAGTVAMANSGPDSNGSQFFLVYGDSQLPPSYTVFGAITGGLDVLSAVAAAGVAPGGRSPTDGAPVNPVTVEDVVVEVAP